MLNVLNYWYLGLFLMVSKTDVAEKEPELNTLVEKNYVPPIKVIRDTFNLYRTSYKVQERVYNVTRYVSWKNIKIMDKYSVPNFIALRRATAEKIGIELGQKLEFILPNGKVVKKVFADYMSDKGKFNTINANRVDFLINEDEKLISHSVKLVIERN